MNGMTHPALADVDSPLLKLRSEHLAKRAACAEAWAAFEAHRKENREKLVKGSGRVVEKAQELHDTYLTLAEETKALEARLLDSFDRDAFGKARAPGIEFGRLDGIAKKFVADWSQDGTADGMKAFVSGASIVPPYFDERIRQLPQRQRFVRSLIPITPTDSDSFNFVRQSVRTIAAAPVAAGALKPTSVVTLEKVTDTVRTIAHLSEPIDRAVLSDFPAAEAFLDVELRYGVLFAEDNQLLNGNGIPPNLQGILTTAGILSQARGTDAHYVAFRKAIGAVIDQDSPYYPDAVVLAPAVWTTISLATNANGDLLSAPIIDRTEGQERLWGLPVIQTRAIANTVGLVGQFGVGARLYDREEATVRVAESGALGAGAVEIFSRNQVVALGEERIGFAVERPLAFCQVTGL
jgi:HK97 family phage major capsid protein